MSKSVKISTNKKMTAGSTDPRIISYQDYILSRANFSTHYYLAGGNPIGSGQDFNVPWDIFKTNIDNYISSSGAAIEDIALRFVHCYDTSANTLYLRMQICTMTATVTTDHLRTVYQLNTGNSVWYELRSDSITNAQNTNTQDDDYLNNISYLDDSGTFNILGNDGGNTYVRNLAFPWNDEILQMYTDNNPITPVRLGFSAFSYASEASNGDANVDWPHGLVLYLIDGNGRTLVDNNSYVTPFNNKSADIATLCPPKCGSYIDPID